MKIIINHFLKENYTVSHSVIMSFKIFYIMEIHFNKLGYQIYKPIDFIDDKNEYESIINIDLNYKLTDNEINVIQNKVTTNIINKIKTTSRFDNSIIIGFHPKGFDCFLSNPNILMILKSKNIKTIIWQDDLIEVIN